MKFSLLTIAIFITLVVFSSCAKPNTNTDTTIYDTIVLHDTPSNNSPYYIKATINGVNVTYNGYTKALKTTGAVYLYGANNSASSSDGIELFFLYPGSYTTPNLGFYSDTSTGTNYRVAHIYSQQNGTQYVDNMLPATSALTANITTVDSLSISGTFSGTVYYDDDSAYNETIINGSFYVPF